MRTLGLPLINNEINLDLIWSKKCVIIATAVADQGVTFSITDTKRYVPVMTLSTWDNARLLEQLKSGFKRTINWNKYQSNSKTYEQDRYLNHLADPSFQVVNKLFLFSFEDKYDRTSLSTYYLSKVE